MSWKYLGMSGQVVTAAEAGAKGWLLARFGLLSHARPRVKVRRGGHRWAPHRERSR